MPKKMPAILLSVLTVLSTLNPTSAQPEERLEQVHEIAKPWLRPPGAPKASDVCFSSRSKHPRNEKDPHDTFKTAEAFGVTRYLWIYTEEAAFIQEAKKSATSFQCTLNSMVTDQPEGGRQRGRIMDLNGNLVTGPWMRTWGDPAWGCANSPEWRESYLAHARKSLDAGADLFQMDDPGLNFTAINWGACFCDYCMAGFRVWLEKNTTPEEQAKLGIADVGTFDYRVHLRAINAPVGDAFGKWDGGALKEHFKQFQQESVAQFYVDMRAAIDAHAGRHITFSSNNYGGRWTFPYALFDFGVAEFPRHSVESGAIYDRFVEARERGKAQVFTLVSEDVALTRRVIATCYASGGHLLIPWDVFLGNSPTGVRRYFGKSEDFADLYTFVRKNADLFDAVEDAAFVVPGKEDKRYPKAPPVTLQGADQASAFLRAVPGNPEGSVAIHLIDWSDTPGAFEVCLEAKLFAGGGQLNATLLRPSQAPLSLDFALREEKLVLQIPPLSPWAIIRLGREDNG
ncbi:MAG: hypothetical protein L3K26_00510 [Candidatus Hydrogenedentes bacterium]|nr:hypothetical protein [Candidatus Hydrogenedentota bacterium]